MPTRYFLRSDVVHHVPEVELAPSFYASLKGARATLATALTLEETYDLLIKNYLDFEQRLLLLTTSHIVRSYRDHSELFESIMTMSLSLANLLSVARQYLDRLPQLVSEFQQTLPGIRERIDDFRRDQHAAHFEYRFMEALRNQAQHQGLPDPTIESSSSWTSHDSQDRLEHVTNMLIYRQRLEGNSFKKSVLEETPVAVDVKAAVRRYVESLSAIHCFARGEMAAIVSSAREVIDEAYKQYSAASSSTIGLTAFSTEDGELLEKFPLVREWDDVRITLQQRNRPLVNLHRQYAVGRSTDT